MEVRRFNNLIPIQNQVEIESPWRAGMRSRTTVLMLDREEPGEKIPSRQRRVACCSCVEELGLIAHTDRIGDEKRRDPQPADRGRQLRQRDAQVAFPIAQVAAQRKPDGNHRCQLRAPCEA